MRRAEFWATGLNASGKIHICEKHGSECDSGTGIEHEFEAVLRCCVPDYDIQVALRDNLAQERAFVVEVKTLKRILEASRENTASVRH